ncbi:MAG: hypothetical protein J0I09_03275 [Sphingobacteriia bacterium]|nr:hypothetical protein [Sphingobacteriia bacterium]
MQEVFKDPVIILILILFFGVIIGFIIFFLITYQKKQLLAKVALETMKQTYETQLAQTRLEVQEQTFQNIASELHDNIGQLLSLTNVTLSSLDLEQVTGKTKQKISDAQELVAKSIKELRQLSKIIQGEIITQDDLIIAFENEIEWLQKKGYFTVEFHTFVPEQKLINKQLNLFIYRLLQECLNNIIKHAKASVINISIDLEQDTLLLSVKDNGVGFNVEQIHSLKKGMGLENIRKRVALLKGSVQINSYLNQGTTIKFKIPYIEHETQNS